MDELSWNANLPASCRSVMAVVQATVLKRATAAMDSRVRGWRRWGGGGMS